MESILRLLQLAMLVTAIWWKVSAGNQCQQGWVGPSCQIQCHCTNNACDNDGRCTGSSVCTQGWFGPLCQNECNCTNSGCESDGKCTGSSVCPSGRFGPLCQYECRCSNNSCDKDGQCTGSSGCVQGWFGQQCQFQCHCSNNSCDKDGQCTGSSGCVQGWFGQQCQFQCHCSNNSCDKVGQCTGSSGCVQGWFGQQCQFQCHCSNNSCDKDGNCITSSGCPQGWVGPACQYACNATYYGEGCAQKCSTNCKNQLCNNVNGNCQACVPGKQGPKCENACNATYYGEGCAQKCSTNCKNQLCNNVNGNCQACVPGKQGPKCENDCSAKYFGENCAKSCSLTCKDQLCHAANGTCKFCEPGVYGQQCEQVCKNTSFGENCAQRCSNDCKDQLCNRTNGNCDSCIPGRTGLHCNECMSTFYGKNCSQRCSVQCKGQLCDAITGDCKSCGLGVSGKQCDQACMETFYGENCAHNCSSNCMDQACSSTTGVCGSCIAGRTGSLCSEPVPSEPDVLIGAIVGPVVAIIMLALVVGIVVIIWRSHRHKKDVPGLGSESQYEEMPVPRRGHSETVPKSGIDGLNHNIPMKPKPPVKAKPDLRQDQNGKHNSNQVDVYLYPTPELSDYSIRVQDLNNFIASHTKEFFQKEFANIPAVSNAPTAVGSSLANKHKNKYRNIFPYDHSRVHLQMDSAKKYGDYINASYINGFKKQSKFIASQIVTRPIGQLGPTTNMLNDFVRMLWEQGTEVVIMLTNLIEEGKLKCEQYWPDDSQIKVGEITVNLTTTQIFADYTIRRLELQKKAEPVQTLTHFHFTTWPSKNVPKTAWGLVDLEKRMAHITTDKPIVVHCSAGVGRTGTFIALHNVLEEIEETGSMNFFSTVQKLCNDRVFMVQTYEQYEFLQQATQIALVCKGTTVTARNIQDRIKILEELPLYGQTNLEKEFKSLCLVFADDEYASVDEVQVDNMFHAGRMATNEMKNRLYQVLPKEYYRPVLACATEDMSDYINAVFVPSSERHDHQFLTQLPLPKTIPDLWRLVTQYKVTLIVAFEKDLKTKDITIGDYLPEGDKASTTSSFFNIKAESVESDVNWNVHRVVITKDTESDTGERSVGARDREHCLSHITCKSTNLNPKTLLALVRKIRTMKPVGEGRIVYMCRDGATFSGLVCTMSLLLDRMDYDQHVPVPLVLGALKAIRPQVIPTLDQYRLLYQALQLSVETSNV